jgi:hypothetical protein
MPARAAEPDTQKGRAMPEGKDQLFADFGHFTVTHGYSDAYQHDPHQSLPLDCGFIL